MNKEHWSDEEIQLFVLEDAAPADNHHLATCEACQARVSSYRSLFAALADEPSEKFDFDLTSLVLEKMTATTRSAPADVPAMSAANPPSEASRGAGSLLILLLIAGLSLPLAILSVYGNTLAGLFVAMKPVILSLIGTGMVTVIVLVSADMYKAYRRKMSLIEMT